MTSSSKVAEAGINLQRRRSSFKSKTARSKPCSVVPDFRGDVSLVVVEARACNACAAVAADERDPTDVTSFAENVFNWDGE